MPKQKLWENRKAPQAKIMNLNTDLTLFTKIKSKWITDINVKYKSIKFLEDYTGENLHDFGYGDDVLDNSKGMIHERSNR